MVPMPMGGNHAPNRCGWVNAKAFQIGKSRWCSAVCCQTGVNDDPVPAANMRD